MKYLGKKYKRKVAEEDAWPCGLCDLNGDMYCTEKQDAKCIRKDAKKGNFGYYVLKEEG